MKPENLTLFEDFYRRYRVYVHGLCRKRFSNIEDVHDLEALIWTEIHRHFDRFQLEDARPLLHKLVTWRARDLYRKRYKEREHFPELNLEDGELLRMMEEVMPTRPRHDERLTLVKALQGENELDRALLFGRYLEGLTWEELAVRHQMHRNSVQKRSKASLERLRAMLDATPSAKEAT